MGFSTRHNGSRSFKSPPSKRQYQAPVDRTAGKILEIMVREEPSMWWGKGSPGLIVFFQSSCFSVCQAGPGIYPPVCQVLEELWKRLKSNPWVSTPMDGMGPSAVGTGVSSSAQSTRLVSEGLAWPLMGCVPSSQSLYLVFCALRSGSLQSLFSKFLVGPWCLVLFIIHTWEVEEEWRCRERSSFLGKGGVQRLQRGGDICFAP